MHLGNGAITPECGAVALGIAALGAGAAFVGIRVLGVPPKRAYTAAALGSAVFAAQSFNVQILPFSSVHLIGGVLLAWILSPPLGALTMTGILTLQALLLGDGGLLALGTNIINMGLMPAVAVALVRRELARRGEVDQTASRSLWSLAATAFACTVAAAGLIVLEVSIGRSLAQLEGLGYFATRMLAWHALAGVAEAVLTVAIVAGLARLAARDSGGGLAAKLELSPGSAGLVVAASLAVALLSLPSFGLASAAPDSYRAALVAAEQSGLAVGQIEAPTKLAGGAAVVQGCQDALAAALPDPRGLMVVLATALAGAIAWGCARTRSRGSVIGESLAGCS
ncbi:MAG TPA: energy-coupling factor ABC transporter permease [Pirellulales bacterium]|jgi:cobalt/nickel transport system permease protein|nr:energy-coupling factor ABC transporter permease [Pirellulales bacterium]